MDMQEAQRQVDAAYAAAEELKKAHALRLANLRAEFKAETKTMNAKTAAALRVVASCSRAASRALAKASAEATKIEDDE